MSGLLGFPPEKRLCMKGLEADKGGTCRAASKAQSALASSEPPDLHTMLGGFALISCDFQSSQSSCYAGVGNGTATAAPGSACADKPCSDQGWVAQRGTVRLWWSDQISAGSEALLQLPWHCCHPACLQQSLFLRPLLCERDGDKSCAGVIFQFTGSCVKVCVCEVDGAFEFEWEHWKRGFRAFKLEGHAEMSSCSKEVWNCQNKLCWVLKCL